RPDTCRITSRQREGTSSSGNPSITSTRAKADQRAPDMMGRRRAHRVLFLRPAGWALEIFQEVRARIEHQHIALALQTLAVGFQAAVERVELRVRLERLRVHLRSARVALALDTLCVAI